MKFTPLGDRAVTITLGTSIDEPTHRLVRAVSSRLDALAADGVAVGWLLDQVPAFVSVVVHYNPLRVPGDPEIAPYDRIVSALASALAGVRPEALAPPTLIEIPVCYGGDFGPDIDDVAARHGMSAADVVRTHSNAEYLVYMVGFMPGFAYLGGLPGSIATPRRSSPRTAVPAGTVGIGGEQTGVYPMVSPGGWNLIGRTPVHVFDIEREPAAMLATGDRVRFRPMSLEEFHAWPGAT